MPNDIEKLSGEIARSTSFDGYSLWRMLKDVNNQIFALHRTRAPVPIELARLRAIIARAQELRQTRDRSREAPARQPEIVTAPAIGSFDAFDFVDHYRALGGLRVAVDMGGSAVEIRQWNKDTPEAADFWMRGWGALGPRRRLAVARALLIRGRY
jgi:hypothetical protein